MVENVNKHSPKVDCNKISLDVQNVKWNTSNISNTEYLEHKLSNMFQKIPVVRRSHQLYTGV